MIAHLPLALLVTFSLAHAATAGQCGWGVSRRSPLASDPLPLFACPRPVDGSLAGSSSDPASWALWTHRPLCTKNATSAATRYCVYTSAAAPRSHGLSILATPEFAARAISLDRILLEERANNRVFSSGTNGTRTDDVPAPYEVRDVPNKGKGLVATRPIPRGTPLLADHAVLLVPMSYDKKLPPDQAGRLLLRAALQLPDPQRVLGLAKNHILTGSSSISHGAASIVEDALVTNDFYMELDGEGYRAVFPETARLNHACNPNAYVRFHEKTLSLTVLATRDIAPGEEITISYIEPSLTYAERQRDLLKRWSFKCRCALCDAPPAVRAASDARRDRLRRLLAETKWHVAQDQLSWAVERCREAIDLLNGADNREGEEEEKRIDGDGDMLLGPNSADALWETLAKLYYALGDRRNTEVYAARALAALRRSGSGSRMTEGERARVQAIEEALVHVATWEDKEDGGGGGGSL